LVTSCEIPKANAQKLCATLFSAGIPSLKRLKFAHSMGKLQNILEHHEPSLSELDIAAIIHEVGGMSVGSVPNIPNMLQTSSDGSLSKYQWNNSPSCLIDLDSRGGRLSSRGGIHRGSYHQGLRQFDVVVKCYHHERDLAREVSILDKLARLGHGDSTHWIIYYYFHSACRLEETYLVLERHGTSLDQYLQEIPLSKDNKRSILKRLCHAVCALHEKGLYHVQFL